MIKSGWQVQRSAFGINFCGYHIFSGCVRVSLRRKRRYQQRRLYWERQYLKGRISAIQLQSCYAAVHAILQGANSTGWRKKNLELHPAISV